MEELRRKGGRNKKQSRIERQEAKRLEKENKRGNRQILFLTYGVVAVFLSMAGYLAYFLAFDSGNVINNTHNPRQELLAERVIKGKILSADGDVLAETRVGKSGKETRVYPEGRAFCHVVGRTSHSLTGIELNQCYPLLTSHDNPLQQLGNTLRGKKNQGDDVITTLDADLQRTAYQALGSNRGAVVAMEPSSGKILAMVSTPAYDPNTVSENWDTLIGYSDEESRLVNRATQGLYTPGSTFKMVTAMEYLMEHPKDHEKYDYRCKGSAKFGGTKIKCYAGEVHGKLNLRTSFAESCNGSFANIGMNLDIGSFRNLCSKLYFDRKLPVDFEHNRAKFMLDRKSDGAEIAQTSMGQGKTLVTPLQNLMIGAMIANDGVMMTPYVIDQVKSEDGRVIKQYEAESIGRVVDEQIAAEMQDMMEAVVQEGTATSLRGLSYRSAGKTGSAEVDAKGTTNAWYVGYAPAKNPQIAVSIVVEGVGTGSRYAVPIAKKMFEDYVN